MVFKYFNFSNIIKMLLV